MFNFLLTSKKRKKGKKEMEIEEIRGKKKDETERGG
jgi:hypothetical protein